MLTELLKTENEKISLFSQFSRQTAKSLLSKYNLHSKFDIIAVEQKDNIDAYITKKICIFSLN